MNQDWINALIGGAIIGLSVSIMLLMNGRVTGISGIINGLIEPIKGDTLWRFLFVAGLFLGGVLMLPFKSEAFVNTVSTSDLTVGIAGLLVGFGTIMGSGCTSGHGVCGISRMSPRSLVATITFIVAGVLAVVLFRKLGVYL
ncbi:MAG: YeeE/YedE family protein [Pseudobdellovibrionaceae bacterium]